MPLNSNAMCSETDLQEYLSAAGVTAFSDHDQSGSSDTNVVNNAINRITSRILDLAGQQYEINAAFIAHQTLKDWSIVGSCYVLCGMRGNPRPDSLAEDYLEIFGPKGLLEQVRAGNYQLYGLAKRGGKAPSFANPTIDRRFTTRKIRVKPNSSSSNITTPPSEDLAPYPGYEY